MHAVARRIAAGRGGRPVAGQQKVVHAADTGNRITQTGSHAGAENGRQHHDRVADYLELALNDVHAFVCSLDVHFSAPKTASIAAFIFSMVKGLASTLLAPSWAALWTSALSP